MGINRIKHRAGHAIRHSRKLFALVALCAVFVGQNVFAEAVERAYVNPANGYTHVVSVTANGVTTLHVSGQVSKGETLEEQLRGAYTALRQQLADAGAELADIVKMTTFIVDYEPADLDAFRNVRDEFFVKENRPASTLIGVGSLFAPGYRVEIEATAILETGSRQ